VVLAEVLLDMEKDPLMMEEERGRSFLLLVLQTHLLSSWNLISLIWFSIKVPELGENLSSMIMQSRGSTITTIIWECRSRELEQRIPMYG
jgi:hypothetical protein